jgi:hypothetical protein
MKRVLLFVLNLLFFFHSFSQSKDVFFINSYIGNLSDHAMASVKIKKNGDTKLFRYDAAEGTLREIEVFTPDLKHLLFYYSEEGKLVKLVFFYLNRPDSNDRAQYYFKDNRVIFKDGISIAQRDLNSAVVKARRDFSNSCTLVKDKPSLSKMNSYIRWADTIDLWEKRKVKISDVITVFFSHPSFCKPSTDKCILRVEERDTTFKNHLIVFYIIGQELIKAEDMFIDPQTNEAYGKIDYFFHENEPIYLNDLDKQRNLMAYVGILRKAKEYILILKGIK